MRDRDIISDRDDDGPFGSFLRSQQSRGPGGIVIILLLIAAVGFGGWWFFLRDRADVVEPTASTLASDPAAPGADGGLVAEEPLELPAVDTSDAFVRRLVAGLSAHPQLGRWLVTDELARRFVTAVAALAQGTSPRPQLTFMAPEGEYAVRESDGRRTVDPAGYGRYDLIARTFSSLDVPGTARLIRQLAPMFEEAHRELGLPGRTFEGDLRRAIENVLAADVPAEPPELVLGEDGWQYADPQLEARSAAGKHLMRMGPENARMVQDKVARLAAALNMAPGG